MSVRPGSGSTGALAVLVLLAVLTPWPFGSAHPLATRIVSVGALAAALVVVVRGVRGDPPERPSIPARWIGGLLALAALQLMPLPAGLHAILAPGSAAVWHPGEPAAAALLGAGPRPISIDPAATRRWLCLASGLVALAVLAAPALRHRRQARSAALVVGAAVLAVALYGIVARTLFGTKIYGLIAVPTIAPFGPFVNKNHFAGYVEMAALLAFGLAVGLADEARTSRGLLGWIDSPRAGRVVLAYGAAAVMVLAILISLSRAGALSLMAGGLAFLLLRLVASKRRRSRRPLFLTLALALAGAALAFTVLPSEGRERVLSLVGSASDSSGRFRLGVWRDTLSVVASSPLAGQGLGAFADALPPFNRGPDMRIEHAENDYLEMLAEGGAFGFLLVITTVVLAARSTVRGLARQNDRLLRGLGMGAAGGAGALLVHSGFDFNLRITSNAVLFTLLCAWVLALAVPPESPAGTVGPGAIAWLALGLALVLGVAVLTPPSVSARRLEAVRDARASPTPLRLAMAEGALAAHLRNRPGDAEAWLHLGWVRAARGKRDEGAALARHAAQLDPQRRSITAGAEALSALAPPK